MRIQDIMTKAMTDILQLLGEEVVYTPKGDLPKTLRAIVGQVDPSIMEDAPPGDYQKVTIRYVDVPSPKKGDAIVIQEPLNGGVAVLLQGETWRVVGNNGGGKNSGMWELIVSRSARRMA